MRTWAQIRNGKVRFVKEQDDKPVGLDWFDVTDWKEKPKPGQWLKEPIVVEPERLSTSDAKELETSLMGRAILTLLKHFGLALIVICLLVSSAQAFIKAADFGAYPNDGIDDTFALQQAFDTACKESWGLGGGIVVLAPGSYDIKNPPLYIRGGMQLWGAGRASCVIQTDAIDSPLLIIDTRTAVTIKGVWFRVWPHADVLESSEGILITGRNKFSAFSNLQISGFSYGLHFENAQGWLLEHSYILCNYRYDVWIENKQMPDTNDSSIFACTFDTNLSSEAAIFQEAGGGLRLVNNKILHHRYGYKMVIRNGVRTSVLIIIGNSIERQKNKSIFIDSSKGRFGQVVIVGNHLEKGIETIGNIYNIAKIGNVGG